MAAGPASGGPAAALILAAGSGERLGAGGPKALVPLAGRAMFEHSLVAFLRAEKIGPVVLAVPPAHLADFGDLIDAMEELRGSGREIQLVVGGASRSDSVAAGLEVISSELVAVHDAARPLVTPDLIDETLSKLESTPEVDAVITAGAVHDTIKRVDSGSRVVETLDRSSLRAVQTPQVFRRGKLAAAIATGELASATDDASLIEADGGAVAVLEAPSFNIKVTVPEDLVFAEAIFENRD